VTFGSAFGVIATLGFVLALLGLALKLLRRFAPAATTGSRLRMEIVQRLSLGPKQGVAVIRVADRLVAVSLGEGGVHRLFELEPSEAEAVLAVREVHAAPPADFKGVLRGALRTAGYASMLVVSLGLAIPATVDAQGAAAQPPTATPQAGTGVVQNPAANTRRPTAAKAAAVTPPRTGSATGGGVSLPQLDVKMGSGESGLRLSGTVGVVVMLGMMTLLPSVILMMTGFTRILIVLHFLRQALGTQSAPPAQLVAGLALLLTGFVMAPTLSEVNKTALQPWLDGKIEQTQMMELGSQPFRAFMLKQTRRQDLETFVRMTKMPTPETANDVPLVTLTSAFVVSELRTAFQIGFALFLPFIVIDIAVASVLMSMGMFMLPPAMIALPFKLLLFVLVDGWSLVTQSLVQSFR
jgi:flagellar biosynthetic protein FliP